MLRLYINTIAYLSMCRFWYLAGVLEQINHVFQRSIVLGSQQSRPWEKKLVEYIFRFFYVMCHIAAYKFGLIASCTGEISESLLL